MQQRVLSAALTKISDVNLPSRVKNGQPMRRIFGIAVA
jgi:hypothetical protein